MALPFYVSPEQFMKEKYDYARKGVAQGKSVLALEYANGILFLAENPSGTLHKISEIYDRVAFAGVGRINELETLRMHGIRQADLRGYAYSREDVSARALANGYGQILGQIFAESMKPFEIEILVGAVGETPDDNELYYISFDGAVTDGEKYISMGGKGSQLADKLVESFKPDANLEAALKMGSEALNAVEEKKIPAGELEVAVLDRSLERRKFRRLSEQEVEQIVV